MSSCLICPSWAPCKCDGVTLPLAYRFPVGSLREQIAKGVVPVKVKPRINIRQKGATGEREVTNTLIGIVHRAMREVGFTEQHILQAAHCIQRNQNQSAVGGNDLSHTFGMSIEVKRQECLSINTWWAQTIKAASPNNELPVLIYRQNHQSWKVITMGCLYLPIADGSMSSYFNCRMEIDWSDFLKWFHFWVLRKLQAGELPKGVKL